MVPNPDGPTTKLWNKPSLAKATGVVTQRKGNFVWVAWYKADKRAQDLVAAHFGTDKWDVWMGGRQGSIKHPVEDLLKPEHRLRPVNKAKVKLNVKDLVDEVTHFLSNPHVMDDSEWYGVADVLDDGEADGSYEHKIGPITVLQFGESQKWFETGGDAGPTAQEIAKQLRGMRWTIDTFVGSNFNWGEKVGGEVELYPAYKPGRSRYKQVFPVKLHVKVKRALAGKRGGVKVEIDYS